MEKGFNYVKEKITQVPTLPGCYLMKDMGGEIFYVGKAKNLKARLRSYINAQDTRIFVQFLENILYDLEIILVNNEKESLLLERKLIQKYKPRFNILLKDDKKYLLLKIKKNTNSTKKNLAYPKVETVRKRLKDGARYFGPFPSAGKLRKTLDLINKHFKLRTCPDHTINNRVRPCLQYQIHRCWAPCVYDIPFYKEEIENVSLFLKGSYKEIEKRLFVKMQELSEQEQFEQAAKVRDQLQAIQTSLVFQAVQDVNTHKDQDVIGISQSSSNVGITHICLSMGEWKQSESFFFTNQHFSLEEILSTFLNQRYLNSQEASFPHEIILPHQVEDKEGLKQALNEKANHPVKLTFPKQGKKLRLLQLANSNASQHLKENLDIDEETEKALEALQKCLELPKKPVKIECLDISIIQGSDAVGSIITFINGKKSKSNYKIYSIKTVEGMNDFAMIEEVVLRRLKRGIKNNDLPDLMIIDGGKGQLNAAKKAFDDANIFISKDSLYLTSIAKARNLKGTLEPSKSPERLFVLGDPDPIILPKNSPHRLLLERIRDEAHRFAITHHRRKRQKRHIDSRLLKIPGVGKVTAHKLLKNFGSLENIKLCSGEEIAAIARVSPQKGQQIVDFLKKSLL